MNIHSGFFVFTLRRRISPAQNLRNFSFTVRSGNCIIILNGIPMQDSSFLVRFTKYVLQALAKLRAKWNCANNSNNLHKP